MQYAALFSDHRRMNNNISENHISVMKEEFLSFFREKQIKTFVDGTLGAAGHSLALLQEHPEITQLIGIDQDPQALALARGILAPYEKKVLLIQSNFERLDEYAFEQVDGIFLDLGVSSMQFDTQERGFSFQKEAPLDMRMGPDAPYTAYDIVNVWEEKEIADLLFELGEERKSRQIAKRIVLARKKKKIETTTELAEIISSCMPRNSAIHPATRSFQALRLAVNRELEVLKSVIPKAIAKLAVGGRLGIISFHSLEDRIVKFAFREAKERKEVEILTKKPLIPTDQEIRLNRRARSAKLRFIERK